MVWVLVYCVFLFGDSQIEVVKDDNILWLPDFDPWAMIPWEGHLFVFNFTNGELNKFGMIYGHRGEKAGVWYAFLR